MAKEFFSQKTLGRIATKLEQMGMNNADSDVSREQWARSWVVEQYVSGKNPKLISDELDGMIKPPTLLQMVPAELRRSQSQASALAGYQRWLPGRREQTMEKVHSPSARKKRSIASARRHRENPEWSKSFHEIGYRVKRNRRARAFGEEYERLESLLKEGLTKEQIAVRIKEQTGISYNPGTIYQIARLRFPDELKESKATQKHKGRPRRSKTIDQQELQIMLANERMQLCFQVLRDVSPLYGDIIDRITGSEQGLSLEEIASKYPSNHPRSRDGKRTREAVRQLQERILSDLLYAARKSGILPKEEV